MGAAGNLTITANSLALDRGTLTAANAAGTGGNVNLNIDDNITLDNNSLISARATGDANGGNIDINSEFVIAFPSQVPNDGNDIIASAERGTGGNINITTKQIFGLEQQEAMPGNGTNDIDASSQFGIDGIVTINTPEVEPTQGLVKLPSEPRNPQPLEGCQAEGREGSSSFINIGRGGLPPEPTEINSNNVWEDLRSPTPNLNHPSSSATVMPSTPSPPKEIREAQGWIIGANGNVFLTAEPPNVSPGSFWQNPADCHIN